MFILFEEGGKVQTIPGYSQSEFEIHRAGIFFKIEVEGSPFCHNVSNCEEVSDDICTLFFYEYM